METTTPLIEEQLRYYRARASEYDQWWLRQGRYDHGDLLNARWFAEAGIVSRALKAFQPKGRILELACGTGIWTQQLRPYASELVAVDGSPEMLRINAVRLHSPAIRYVEADIFQWQPDQQFDTIFFGFWLSHVPPEQFSSFWQIVNRCLAPGGRVFFVDSRFEATSTALDHQLPPATDTVVHRRLNDGREFQICKVFYEAAELMARLGKIGWEFDIQQTANYFLLGAGAPK
jgi:demethylmenaquinone methyltransferase/2-methoxy-6-polyprenyl-1,4-benzoquinol methylase